MGGYGSGPQTYGRWRSTVEQCTALDVNKLARDGLFRRAPHAGALTWHNTHTGEKVAAVGFRVERGSMGGLVLNLTYTKTPRGGDAVDVAESIHLTSTFPHFGGLRRWLVCPLVVKGRACHRRVGKLYLPPRRDVLRLSPLSPLSPFLPETWSGRVTAYGVSRRSTSLRPSAPAKRALGRC